MFIETASPFRRSIVSLLVSVTAGLAGCATTSLTGEPCADLTLLDDAGVKVATSSIISDAKALPPFCQVTGVIDPDIRFEARFPTDSWNGRYYQSGCGGFCGAVLADKPGFSNSINEALKRGYATITTDSGHAGDLGDASWAQDDPDALEVYAHRGIALTHRAGTRLVKLFYKLEPDYEYFGGCSNGGRMAAMAAQRYPTLFDGILGGDSVLHLSFAGGVYGTWVVRSNTRPDGTRILTNAGFAARLPLLEREILAQCDSTDGQIDGVISQPRQCEVDVDALPSCTGAAREQCFTAEESKVLSAWYQGPRTSEGRQLFPGMPPGSERYWRAWFLDSEKRVAPGNSLGGDYAKYIGLAGMVSEDFTVHDFDFETDPPKLARTGAMVDALAPDLSAFRDAGGKFLMWHGWADPLVLPDQSVAYYQAVSQEMGGSANLDPFFRLFMIPGHGHCWEMPGAMPDRFNPIDLLERWVEKGEAPDEINVQAAPVVGHRTYAEAQICPYPGTAHYGSAKEPVCLRPSQ